MPELPEIQALAERLTESFAGASLEGVIPYGFSALKTVAPEPSALVGEQLQDVGRRGKYLLWRFDRATIAVHLSQGGRVDIEVPAKRTKPRGSVVRFSFGERGSCLVKEFGTERKAGWWVLSPEDDGPLAQLGPEPDSEAFAALIRTSDDGRRLHTVLRDQRTVAGIGRGYTDDILNEAELSPFASLKGLPTSARERLLTSIQAVLAAALAGERARAGGLPAKLGARFTVHGRVADPCPRCGEPLARVSYESYELVYCPRCQTGGQVLADRRMSRLLK